MFKIKMINSVVLAGFSRNAMFHKGRIYNAMNAVNQPDWEKEGKVFALKGNGHSMLVEKGDYVKV